MTTEDALLPSGAAAAGAGNAGSVVVRGGQTNSGVPPTTTTTHKFPILNDEANNSCSSLKKPKTCRQKCLILSSAAGIFSILSAVIW